MDQAYAGRYVGVEVPGYVGGSATESGAAIAVENGQWGTGLSNDVAVDRPVVERVFAQPVREVVRQVVRQGERQPLRPVVVGGPFGAAPVVPRRGEQARLEAGVLVAARERLRCR